MSDPFGSSDHPTPDQGNDRLVRARADGDGSADLAAAYAELQNLLLETPEVEDFFAQVARLAANLFDDSSCGITLRRDHQIVTIATSDQLAAQIDEIQYGRGQGPCLHSLHTGETVLVHDLNADDRWGDYRIHALTRGVRSSLSLPLVVDGEVRGAMNLYATAPDSFTDQDIDNSKAFARQAATGLTIMVRRADQTVLEEQMREALATRVIVDQAVGIIMGQQGIDADEAFGVLRCASQARNRKLRDIAADLIQTVTGKPPKPPRPFTNPR